MWRSLHKTDHWQGQLTNRQLDGSCYTVWATRVALREPEGRLSGYMSVQTDVTALQHAQVEIAQLAAYDALTGQPNRLLFRDRLGQQLAQARHAGQPFSVFFLDLDHFKDVNDTQGHRVGDELLKRVATRLQAHVRAQDTVARMGGDEFVVLLPKTPPPGAKQLGGALLHALAEPMDLPGLPQYRVQASLGMASWPTDGDDAKTLLPDADTAMYAAQTGARNRLATYEPRLSEQAAHIGP